MRRPTEARLSNLTLLASGRLTDQAISVFRRDRGSEVAYRVRGRYYQVSRVHGGAGSRFIGLLDSATAHRRGLRAWLWRFETSRQPLTKAWPRLRRDFLAQPDGPTADRTWAGADCRRSPGGSSRCAWPVTGEISSAGLAPRRRVTGVDAVEPDDVSAGLGHVPKQPPQELFGGEAHRLVSTVSVVAVREGDVGGVCSHDAPVADGTAAEIPGEILDDAVTVRVALLDPDVPGLLVQPPHEVRERDRV